MSKETEPVNMAEAIRAVAQEKGISEDAVKLIVEDMIKAAYKSRYNTSDNCIVQISDDLSSVKVFSRRMVVDVAYSECNEIELEDAVEYDPNVQIGDEIDIPVDPKNFARTAVDTGKQRAHTRLNESLKESLTKEYSGKVGTIVVGYYQRENKNNIYVDLGKQNVEGFLPVKGQSPAEVYQKGDRIRALVTGIKPINTGIQLVLSRTDVKFVEKIVEQEVPEIADGTISIFKIAREPGKKTKIAVYSNKPDVDPVGACVGMKGSRIQNVTSELEGEKIDVLPYDEDPHQFIKNALSPAEVSKVILLNNEKKEALAIVSESQFSFAIGKQGQNVRLANRLCDWIIDVKTEAQAAEMDIPEEDSWKAAESLFSTPASQDAQTQNVASEDGGEEYEEITTVAQLPDVDPRVAEVLKNAGIEDIEDFVAAESDGTLKPMEGLSEEDIQAVSKIISEYVVFEDEEEEVEESAGEDEDVEYLCPECGTQISLNTRICPKCGAELAFE